MDLNLLLRCLVKELLKLRFALIHLFDLQLFVGLFQQSLHLALQGLLLLLLLKWSWLLLRLQDQLLDMHLLGVLFLPALQ